MKAPAQTGPPMSVDEIENRIKSMSWQDEEGRHHVDIKLHKELQRAIHARKSGSSTEECGQMLLQVPNTPRE